MLRPVQLSQECARVLGSLVEKRLTTPQQYPLTINALVAACNQTSNREPVVTYDEATVQAALDELRERRLVRLILPSHGRSVGRYRHVLDEALGLDDGQCAILGMLLLRGPQTVGELRTRTERMARFDGLGGVQHELDLLHARDEPLAVNIGRRPGQKEERWASPLVASPDPEPLPDASASQEGPDGAGDVRPASDDLHAELRDLRSEVAALRHELDQLRASLGG
jgi:uncharacterized protein YceH (UPF0502 family)